MVAPHTKWHGAERVPGGPPEVKNVIIYYGLFRRGFSSSGTSQYSGSVMKSGSEFVNNNSEPDY